MNIGDNIKRIRKAQGMTQKELGARLGISQAAIGQFENNSSNLKMDTIKKIADALEITEQELLGYDDKISAFNSAWNEHRTLEDVTIENKEDVFTIDGVLISDKKLLNEFHALNAFGKKEAITRVAELKHIPGYTGDDGLPF